MIKRKKKNGKSIQYKIINTLNFSQFIRISLKRFKALAVKNVIDKYGIVDGKGKHRYQDPNSVPNINDEDKK